MSNLLKRQSGTGVSSFGFPVIDDSCAGRNDPEESEYSEPDPAEVFRKKLLELERRTQEIEKEAYARGFAQGERDGLEYGQKTVQVIKTQLERTMEALETLPSQIFSDYRTWFITNCVRLAKRVVRKELSVSPEILATTLNAVLDEAEEHSSLTAYLHPLDIEFIEKRADLVLNTNNKRFTIKPDGSLERGGCRIESDVQLLDASVDRQFEVLEEYLLTDPRLADCEEGTDD